MSENVVWFEQLGMHDVDRVGGKNASLGEMISNLSELGVSVPHGFATTASAFREFLANNGLKERIDQALAALAPLGWDGATPGGCHRRGYRAGC